MYGNNGRKVLEIYCIKELPVLSGILLEDKTPLIKDVYCKPRAATGKKYLSDINYQSIMEIKCNHKNNPKEGRKRKKYIKSSKMEDFHPTILIITLNINGLINQ